MHDGWGVVVLGQSSKNHIIGFLGKESSCHAWVCTHASRADQGLALMHLP